WNLSLIWNSRRTGCPNAEPPLPTTYAPMVSIPDNVGVINSRFLFAPVTVLLRGWFCRSMPGRQFSVVLSGPLAHSVLAFELVVTIYIALNKVGRDAMGVPDELEAQSGT